MGRGKSSIVTKLFIKEQTERVSGLLDDNIYPEFLGEPGLFKIKERLLKKNATLLQEIPTDLIHLNTVFDSHIDLHKFYLENTKYTFSDEEINAFKLTADVMLKIGYTFRAGQIAEYVETGSTNILCPLEDMDTDFVHAYKDMKQEWAAKLNPHVDGLKLIYQRYRVPKSRRIEYRILKEVGESLLRGKVSKLSAYQELADIKIQADRHMDKIVELLIDQPVLSGLESDTQTVEDPDNAKLSPPQLFID